MWYIESGDLKGTSQKELLDEAFIDVLEMIHQETGQLPELGVLAVGSKHGFDFDSDPEALFFQTVPVLIRFNKVVFESPDNDAVLSEEYIDAPNSREDYWPDVVIESE